MYQHKYTSHKTAKHFVSLLLTHFLSLFFLSLHEANKEKKVLKCLIYDITDVLT